MFICDICDEGEHCIDCPKNYSDEQCEHWVKVDYVRHGYWILEREPNGKPYCFHCSVCDDDFRHGAKMDEEVCS